MLFFFGVMAFHVVNAGGCKPLITFANHMAKARTPVYTWIPDLAFRKESAGDVLDALLHGTLSKIQKIIDTGYIVLRTYYVPARVTTGDDSAWLRHFLG